MQMQCADHYYPKISIPLVRCGFDYSTKNLSCYCAKYGSPVSNFWPTNLPLRWQA